MTISSPIIKEVIFIRLFIGSIIDNESCEIIIK